MNGQTGTSDEKAFVGSAEVHERILDDWHHSRLRRYANIINYKLIPFLVYHGYPLEGLTGTFKELMAVETPGGNEQGPDADGGQNPKKKVKPGPAAVFPW